MENRALALFDFDGTLIRGDSIVRYVKTARKKRLMRPGEWLMTLLAATAGMARMMTDEKAKTVAMRFWTRMSAKQRRAFDEEFAGSLIKTVYEDGLEEMERCRREGMSVVLVSASTENYMRLVAEVLGVDALLCTRIDGYGVVTDNCKGREKLRRIDRWLRQNNASCDRTRSRAYGDTGSDYFMLTAYGSGVCVNPKRALLKKTAGRMPVVHWQ